MAAILAAPLAIYGQKALPPPPPGFESAGSSASREAMKQAGVADIVIAQKPNDNWPGCILDPKIEFTYGWTLSPGAGQAVGRMAQAPEDPPTESMGTRDEPAGKASYKGGVLTWRKTSTLAAGMASSKCPGNRVEMYNARWVAYAEDKMLSVGLVRVYGGKAQAQAWLDEYIPKVQAAAAGK